MSQKCCRSLSSNEFFVLSLMISNLKTYSMEESCDTIPQYGPSFDRIPIEEWFQKVSDSTFDCNPSLQEDRIGMNEIFFRMS